MTLQDLATFARNINATFHLSWSASGYRAAFVSADGTGEIATTRTDADAASQLAVDLVKNYTRPDGTIEWAKRQEAYERGRKMGESE